MKLLSCALLFTATLTAQPPFQATRQTSLPPIVGATAVAVGDIDGDGDLDLVVANGANGSNQVLVNDGTGGFVDETGNRLPQLSGADATHAVDLADVDGDGDLDLLWGNAQNLGNRLFFNDGRGAFVELSNVLLPANAATTVDQIVGDFDGDGDADWFLVDRPDAHLWLNQGGLFVDASASNLLSLPQGLGCWYSHGSAADLDGDGDLDLLVPAWPLPVILWNQGQAVFAPAATALPIPAYFFGSNRASDLDGDGDLDLLLDNGSQVLLNDGHGQFGNATAAAFGGAPVTSPAAFDVDGDGRMDVLTVATLWHNDGNARFTPHHLPQHVALVAVLHSAAADFDGDGDLDLAGLANFAVQVDAPAAPLPGQGWALDLHASPSLAAGALLFLAVRETNLPLAPLGTWRLDPGGMVLLAVQLATGAPLRLNLPIPNQSALSGLRLFSQAVLVDPQAELRFSNLFRDVVQ